MLAGDPTFLDILGYLIGTAFLCALAGGGIYIFSAIESYEKNKRDMN